MENVKLVFILKENSHQPATFLKQIQFLILLPRYLHFPFSLCASSFVIFIANNSSLFYLFIFNYFPSFLINCVTVIFGRHLTCGRRLFTPPTLPWHGTHFVKSFRGGHITFAYLVKLLSNFGFRDPKQKRFHSVVLFTLLPFI